MRLPKSPVSALPGERLAGIGHNNGPSLDGGRRWRVHAWKKARAELLPRLPLEIMRRRIRRARQLGLEYPQYASILLGTGRDIVAFLFTSDSLGLDRGDLPRPVAEKLTAISGCDRALLARGNPAALAAALSERGIPIRALAAMPAGGDLREGRAAIRNALDPLKLPGDAVVMVGTREIERAWADEAHLARFLSAETYFASPAR